LAIGQLQALDHCTGLGDNATGMRANYGVRIMGRPTKKMIGAALAICVICIVIGVHYFRWQGVDTSVANDPDYASAGGIR
jgi:hypothetical protein